MIGKIRVCNRARGFGWLETEAEEVFFFHLNDVVYHEELRRGQVVAFTPTQGPRGPRACAVQILQPATGAPRPSA
jgi:cold shock protein